MPLRRLSRCACAGSVLLALSTRIAAASAAELVDPSSGFHGLFVAFLSKKKVGLPAQPPNQWPR